MTLEVKNLITEIEQWVTQKEDAIYIVVLLIDKFAILPQDFIDTYRRLYEKTH